LSSFLETLWTHVDIIFVFGYHCHWRQTYQPGLTSLYKWSYVRFKYVHCLLVHCPLCCILLLFGFFLLSDCCLFSTLLFWRIIIYCLTSPFCLVLSHFVPCWCKVVFELLRLNTFHISYCHLCSKSVGWWQLDFVFRLGGGGDIVSVKSSDIKMSSVLSST
jgi:hypothetical protein